MAELWVTLGGTNEPGLLYPPVTATWVGAPTLYILQSQYPQVSEFAGRAVWVDIFNDATSTWYPAFYSDNEIDLVTPIPFNITGLNMDRIRTTYVDQLTGCTWVSENGAIEPPGCVFPGDHDCNDHDQLDHY